VPLRSLRRIRNGTAEVKPVTIARIQPYIAEVRK
jgi:hypothetical protein